ncbi:peptidoglycan-binding domain-containing protein [Streptomyces sp. NPDC086777]|uniref:peptidoglycan-binding domain-containing protein n=1 Tax=Streptomyces sp. NPDC086777 TaxID=3154866 RepID=UPI00344B2461
MTDTPGSGGHQCPECGTPKGPDGSPACECNQRTADALRDARTAEQAAAEDFDPLRIRPYVAIEADAAVGPGDGTAPLPVLPEPTVPLRTVAAEAAEAAPARQPRRGPRWALLLAVAGAVAAIIAVAGLASGLFARMTPTRDGAAPADVRQSVPDVTPSTASPSAAAPVSSPSSSPSATPSGPASPSASRSPSPTPSGTPASPTPSRSAPPAGSATTAGTAASAQPSTAPVLRPGDTGAEVTELQQRLAQLNLYTGQADGHYDRRTEDAVRTYQLARGILTDESGVYGTATRAALEAETSEP